MTKKSRRLVHVISIFGIIILVLLAFVLGSKNYLIHSIIPQNTGSDPQNAGSIQLMYINTYYDIKLTLPESWKEAKVRTSKTWGRGFGNNLYVPTIDFTLEEPIAASPGNFRTYEAIIDIFTKEQKPILDTRMKQSGNLGLTYLGMNNKYIFYFEKILPPGVCDTEGKNCFFPTITMEKAWKDIDALSFSARY